MITLILVVFVLGYLAVIFEHPLKINKAAPALIMGALCWIIYLLGSQQPLEQDISEFNAQISEAAQIIFFLLGALAIVELIDSHKGFKVLYRFFDTKSKRQFLWIVTAVSFFLSAILDNLTTTIILVTLVRKIVAEQRFRWIVCVLIVVAANAGGAWTPIGDITTTMLWIEGRISSGQVMKALLVPCIVSILVPLIYYTSRASGTFKLKEHLHEEEERGAKMILTLGLLGLISVPIFKAAVGLAPFMAVFLVLALLWLITDGMHVGRKDRSHLRLPHILTRIDFSSLLFFLGILITVAALQRASILEGLAAFFDPQIYPVGGIAAILGIASAVIDNIPLVAATIGMYPLETFPSDSALWHLIAYATGTGGSLLLIGSSSGIALMSLEKIDFTTYLKIASFPILIGYLLGIGTYFLLT